jgi:hypothetical protein
MVGCHHGSIPSTHGMPDHDRRGEVQGRDEIGDIANRGFWGIVPIRRPRGVAMPALIKCQHVVGVSHGLAKGVPGVRVALKTMQQDERGTPWAAPLHVVELQTIDGNKFILSEGGQAHSALLSHVMTRLCVHYAASIPRSGVRVKVHASKA